MKIDRKKIFNRCGFDQRECYELAVRLAALNEDELIAEIKKINVWHYGKCELGLWADVLDRLDEILADGVMRTGQWTLKLDQPGHEHLVGKIIAILEFTGHLIEHSIYRYLYGSWEHILALFGTANMDILHALLGLFYNFSKRSNYFSRLDATNRKIVLERLDSIAENWGGKQHGFGLAECCVSEYMPFSAGTMQYEFMQDVSPSSSSKEELSQLPDVFIKPKCHRRKLTLRNLHLQTESPSELMENLIQKYNITNTSDQMALFARLRLCVYFGKPEQRKLLIFTRMQALSILCYTNEVEDKCLSWDIVEELVDVLKLPDREFLGIKACALRTLTAIIHCGKLASCWPVLKNMTGMNSYHGHFPTMMRDWISDLVQGRFQPYASTVEQMYTTAILSFLYHLACTNEVNSTNINQGNLVGTGLLDSMKDIIMWHTHEPDYISFATRAVRVTDQILLSFQLNSSSTNQKNTIDAIVDRLKFEIKICLESEIDEVSKKSVALNTQRVGFIKSMLNLIKRLILDNEWSETLQSTMDGELPDILRQIFMNYTTKFNPQLCLFSMEVITNFVYNHPSSMSAIQERQLTRDILRTLTEQPLPVNRDFLVTLPTLLSALSINMRGITEIKESRIIDKYIKTLTDSRFVTAMRNKRIREMMTPSESADTTTTNHSHPSTPTSYQMSNAMNELARANSAVFKPIIYDAISKAFRTVTNLGQKQPAPLLASAKPSTMQKSLHRTNGEQNPANIIDDHEGVPQSSISVTLSSQQEMSGGGGSGPGTMFSSPGRDNNSSDILAVLNAVEEADREVEQIMEMSGDEDDGVADNEMTQAIDAEEDRTPSDGCGKESSKPEEINQYNCDDDAVYLMDYICNVCKFMERFLSDQQPEHSLRQQIYSEEGLKTILDILTIPSLPYDFPSSPACQSMQKIFEYLLSWATSNDAILIYKTFFSISRNIGARLRKLEQPQIYSILLKDYVNRSEEFQDPLSITTVNKSFWEENGVCLLHDLVILSTIVVIYDKITDRLSTNLRQDILVELKNGIIDYAQLLPLLNWEAMVLMNLLFEDEEACLEDLKRLCINERGSYSDIDQIEDASCFIGKKSSLSTCQQLFSDNPRSEKIIKRMLQITQKAANDMVELLVTLTKFCCVKPDYSYVVRVRYNRVNGSIPTGKNKLALLNKIAEHCKSLLERESPYTMQASQDSWPEDPHSELPVDKACQKILSDIKFLHPMKYFCFTTIHRILTGGDLQKKPFLGFFYAFQMNSGLEVFFECANELLDTIKYIQYLDPNTNSSVKIMLESFLITVDRMTQIRRITQEFVDSTDKELKDRFDIDLYQRMIRAYMLEPISKLFSFSSLDIDLLNNQSQESLMNIIAFLTSYIFDRDLKKQETEETTEVSNVALNEEHERTISHHIDFIMELGFSRESARRALEENDYDPTQAVSYLFNADSGSLRMMESSSVITEKENASRSAQRSNPISENAREISAIEARLKELETKNVAIKEMIKESFLINLFNLQKEKGIDIITRIVDILLLTGQINEFLEKILAINGCSFLTSDDAYSSVLKNLILTHSGKEISGANIEDSPNGLHILTLLYNKIRFQVTSSFKNHDMVTRLVKMTNLLFKSFMATSTQTETFKTTVLKHITQLWLILDQYERTAFALRIRRDVIYEYQGCPTWFWIDDRHGIWHPISAQHNTNINRSYRNGQLKAYSKPTLNNEYVFNFVSLTQKNEESQTERPIMLLPNKLKDPKKSDSLSEYESKIISCVPDKLGDDEVVELSDNMLQFLISIKKIDNVYKWDCLQAACYLLIRLCDRYSVANERLAAYKSAIPRLCTIPHLKGYTQQLVTFVMTLLRQQFETPQLLKHTISDILDKNIPKGACVLHKTTSFNEKLSKDMFYFIWDNIPLLVRDFDTTIDLMTKKIDLNSSNKDQLVKAYTISKSATGGKTIPASMELEKKQIAIVKFLVESALTYYIEKNDIWSELFKKLKIGSEHDLKNMITSPNYLLETATVVSSNLENNFSFNQHTPNHTKHNYKLTGKEFLIYLGELIFSYEQVGQFTINFRILNRPISFYLVNIYLQEACALLDSIRSKDPGSNTSPSLGREQTQFQQLVSLQIIEAFLLTVKESYDLIISEIVRNLKMRSHHKDGDCRNTYIVVIMKLLNDLITRLPVAVSKKLVILMYKYRLPNDLCRLLSVVDCSVAQHKSVLVDILTVIDSLCRPDRQMYINKRQRSSKSNLELLNKRQRRLNNTADSQVSSVIPGTSTVTNEITSQEMETDDVFYVDINAWSRNSRTENVDNTAVDNLENLDTSNTDEHPVDVDDDEEMDDYDEVDGVMMSEFRDIDAEYDFDEPQMYDDDNNTESETDYEEIEEDEGSAGSQDGDSQGDRFDEDIRDTENSTHTTGRQQEQSRRIFQILNHNYYNINQDGENPELPRHDPESSLRDRLNNVLMTSTYDHQPSYLLNDGFSLDAPSTQEDTNTFRLADNLYFVTNSRDYEVSNQSSNYYPNDLAGCSNTVTNNLIRTSSLESPATSQNPSVPTGSQEDSINGRGWRGGLTYAPGARYMRLEARTLRQNTIRNILTLNRSSFMDRAPNARSPTNRFVDADLSLDSLEGDFEMQDILARALSNIPSGWNFLINQSSSPPSTINNFTFNDISMITNFRRWIVEARTLYGREITDLVMLARAQIYQHVLSKQPETEDKDALSMKVNIEKMVDNIIENADVDRSYIDTSENTRDMSMDQDLILQPDIMIETYGEPNETVIGEEMITPTPSETMETREEPVIENIEIEHPDELVSRTTESIGAVGGAAPANDDDIDHLSMEQLIAEGIDPSFLEALPPSMRREVIIEHRRANRVRQQLNGVQLPENVDAEIMAQLPPHIQEEILAHYRRESATNDINQSTLANPVVTGAVSEASAMISTAAGVVDSSFLLSLAPSLRREILSDMDQSQIASLSTELADEARQVRQETGDAQMRALQANLLSVTGRRRARQLTSGLSDLLSQMHRGRWDQRNVRYVVFSDRGQTNRHNNPASDTVAESNEWPNLSAYKPLVSTDGLTNLIALLITSSTSPSVMKMISTLVNKILQSLTCHSQIRAWISCTLVNILLKISLPKENTDMKPKIFSSPSNSESSILCTPIGSGSCTDLSRSSSIQDETFRQYPNNKSLFFHSFERGFALTDQVFVPSVSKIYKHKNKSGIQSLEMPEITIHESVSGSVAKALIDSLSTISSMHTKEFYPTSQSSKIPTNFWFTLAWYMSLKSVSLEDSCPETHLPPNEEYDYFTHLLCLVRLPLMQTNNSMLEKLLLTIHNILKAYYKSFGSKEKTVTEWSGNLQAVGGTETDPNVSRQQTATTSQISADTAATLKEKSDIVKTPGLIDPHLNRVNVKTISHLVNIICAKECSNQAPLPTDKCRVLSERLLIELSKGNTNTKQDIIKLLTSNIETVLETLTGVLHKVLDEAVLILEKECNEASINEASGSNASPIKKSSTFTESLTNDILASNMSPSYDMAFTSASTRRSQSQVSSGYSRNNSLPHIAFNQLKMESIKPFTANTGDHLNLLDLFNLLRKVDNSILIQFQSPSPIWHLLSQVLDAIQRSKEPDAVIVFQSLVESFLLCHSDCHETVEEHTKSETSALSDSLSHLNTTLVVDTFMNSPAFSESGKHNPFLEFVEKHKKVLNHILRRRNACALDQSNFSALLKYPKLLDFDIKRRYFQAKIAQLRNEGDSRYEEELVQVSRARLFEDSYGRLHRKTAEEWKQRFCIKFINEEGQDGGGLLREWYLKMSHEIFNPNYALFKVSPDGVTYTINPASYVNNNHLSYFKFVGRFIAKAIFDNKLLTCYFTRAFYKHILGISIRYTDLEKEDYQFFRGLEFLLKNDVSTMFLDQSFSIQISEFGQTETRDLLPNGSQVSVTEENKAEYVRLVCQEKMTGAIRQQLHSFLEGFYEIIPKNLISIFNEKELELLICGLPEIDLNDLKLNTVYNKYTPASPQIQWFWQALESFDQEDRARFIQFVTGTSKVPLGGFSKLEGMNGPTKFQISLASMSTNHLPAAHTCFNSIDLPQYESYEKLHKCLLTAIRECSEGYGMI